MLEQERIGDWFRGRSSIANNCVIIREEVLSQNQRWDADALRLATVQALGQTREAERARHLVSLDPAEDGSPSSHHIMNARCM